TPLAPFISIGYGQRRVTTHTPMNVAFSDNLNRAVTGTYPNYVLDYSQIRIAEGYSAGGSESASVADGELVITWAPTLNKVFKQEADDLVYVVLYHPEIDQLLTTPEPPQRIDGLATITLPAYFQTGVGHVWLFTTNRKGKRVSKSVYLGEVALG